MRARELIPFLDEPYVLFNPGGGGHLIGNEPGGKVFEDLAGKLHRQTGVPVVLVYGPNYNGPQNPSKGVFAFTAMEPEIFNVTIKHACVFISGGGGALFQAAAYQVPTWAISLSPDQDRRIEALCSKHDFIKRYSTFEDLTLGIKTCMSETKNSVTISEGNEELISQRIEKLLN